MASIISISVYIMITVSYNYISAADFLVYIVVCLQMGYFRNNPLRSHSSDHFVRHDNDFLQFNFFIDYIKVSS